jgi:hypothetical protein
MKELYANELLYRNNQPDVDYDARLIEKEEIVEDIENERMMDEGPYSQHSNWSILDAAAREAELEEGRKPLITIAEIMANPKVPHKYRIKVKVTVRD